MKKCSIAFIVFSILGSQDAFARSAGGGITINGNAMYLIGNTTNGPATTNSNRTLLDGVLGYRFSNSIFVGGTYDSDSQSTTVTGPSPSTNTIGVTSYGVTAGYDTGNFYVLGTYFIGSEYDSTTGGVTTAETGGSGFQAAIGYRFNVNSKFAIGPQFSYRSLNYTTQQIGSAPSTSVNSSATALVPYINFTYCFGGSSSDD